MYQLRLAQKARANILKAAAASIGSTKKPKVNMNGDLGVAKWEVQFDAD